MTQAVKFGLAVDHQYEPGTDIARAVDETVELVELARDLGFDSVFGIHHYLSELDTLQPLTLLARLVPVSGAMALGTGIFIVTLAHPVHLAEEIATLDQLSGGRVVLGIGAGYRDEEFDSFGIDRGTRGARLVEAVEVMRGLWSGETVSFDGRFFRLDSQRIGMPPAQPGGPPILVGATTPDTIRRAARIGDSWLATFSHKLRWAAGHLEIYRDALEELGRPVEGRDYPIQRELHLADSHEAAAEEVGPFIRRSYAAYAGYQMDYLREMYDDLRVKAFLLGSPEEVAEGIEAHCQAGFNHFIFRVQWLGLPHEVAKRTLERFAAEVMPRFSRAPANQHQPVGS